jgi:flagellar hook-associated protein 2
MGTITMTGYNNIDWNAVLTAVMSQEKQPLVQMQTKYTNLQVKQENFATLATKLSALESKADDLRFVTTLGGRKATTSDSTAVAIDAGGSAAVGAYDIVVNELARAQVSTSQTTVAGKDTVVANGGSLTINGQTVTLTGDTTLQELAQAINATENIGVTATIVSARGAFRMVLTSDETGESHGFSVQNDLAGSVGNVEGGPSFAFNDTPVVLASDADLTVNNVNVTSETNTIADVIPGATISVLRKTTASTTVTIAQDASETKGKVDAFVSAYNDLVSFFSSQAQDQKDGKEYALTRESLIRTLRSEINSAILGSVSTSGSLRNLSDVGIEFNRDGTLKLNASTFNDAVKGNQADLDQLFAGGATTDGAFDAIKNAINTYTRAGGLLPDARTRLSDQLDSLDNRISSEEARLELRRQMLQREYADADSAIATLNSQGNSLSGLTTSYK